MGDRNIKGKWGIWGKEGILGRVSFSCEVIEERGNEDCELYYVIGNVDRREGVGIDSCFF